MRLLRVLGRHLTVVEERVDDLQSRSAEQRVVREILRLADDASDSMLTVTHDQIASHALVVRETATKVLNALERAGIVRTGYRSLVLLDRAGLEARAGD